MTVKSTRRTPRKSRIRGSAALIRRSRNSYIRSPRNVTLAPMAWSLRNLKFEMLFFARVSAARWPVINASSVLASSSACFTSACDPTEVLITTFVHFRDLMHVFVSVLLLQSRHHPFLVVFVKFVFHLLTCHSELSRRISNSFAFSGFVFVSFFASFLVFSSFSIKRTLEIWIGPSRSAILPLGLSCDFRRCFLIIRTPSINTRCFFGNTCRIFPLEPRKFPRDHLDVVAFFHVKLDPVHRVKVAQASSLWVQQASRLRDFDRRRCLSCPTARMAAPQFAFVTTPPAPARRSS